MLNEFVFCFQQHRVSKGSSGVSKSVSQPKVGEKSKQFLSSNEVHILIFY